MGKKYTSAIISSKDLKKTWVLHDLDIEVESEEIAILRIKELFELMTGSLEFEIKLT